jgi:predicted RNase H-like nuclease (RuvC/YqgF family)
VRNNGQASPFYSNAQSDKFERHSVAEILLDHQEMSKLSPTPKSRAKERNLLRNQVAALEKRLESLQALMADFQLTIAQDVNVEEELRRLDDTLTSMLRAEDLPD